MKFFISLFLLLSFLNTSFAQNAKKKQIKVPYISYPTDVPVKSYNTYFIDIIDEEDKFTGIDLNELRKSASLQAFSFDSENPNLSIFINGIQSTDLYITNKRNKSAKTYTVKIMPKKSALIRALTIVDGISTHLMEFPLKARIDSEKKEIPEVFTFKFDEADKYLEMINEDQFKLTPYFIDKYIEQVTEGKLTELVSNYIKEKYDTRIDLEYNTFYYLKNKKTPSLEESTKKKITDFEKAMSDVSTFNDLEGKKEIISDFRAFWQEKLDASLAIGKKNTKTSWDLTKNLYNISLLSNDFKQADLDFTALENLDTRKLAMFIFRGSHKSIMNKYNKNFDDSNTRLYADKYEVQPFLESINNHMATESYSVKNDLSKVEGFIVTKDGEKIEGKISLRFSPPEETQGSIVDVSVGSGKSLTLFYMNEKGKNRSKSYKAKNIQKFVVNGKTYESVFPKKNILDGSVDALELSLNNALFMELIFETEGAKLYKDQMERKTYFLKIPSEKKSFPVSTAKNWSKYFETCTAINQKLADQSYEINKTTIIELVKLYSTTCK